jgi:hypothetical protein
MHDEPVKQHDLSPATIEHLDQRIVRVLETVPRPYVPTNFAARVASQLPTRRPVSLTPTHYGHKAMLLSMVAAFMALIVLAPRATGHATFELLEWLLFAQFIVLAVWFSVRRHSLR